MSEREQKPPPCLDSEKCPRVAACLESSKLCHELGRVDRNFFKAMGIIIGLVAFSTALGPMLAFQKHCTRSNPDMLKMRAGPSYICMGFAVFLKATTVVAHLALRAPGHPSEESVARRLAWISMD